MNKETLVLTPVYNNKHFVNYYYLGGFKYSVTKTAVVGILNPTTLSFSDVMMDGFRILVRSGVIDEVKGMLEDYGFTVIIRE